MENIISVIITDAQSQALLQEVSYSQKSSFKLSELAAMNSHFSEKFGGCDIIWGTNTDNTLDQKAGVFML